MASKTDFPINSHGVNSDFSIYLMAGGNYVLSYFLCELFCTFRNSWLCDLLSLSFQTDGVFWYYSINIWDLDDSIVSVHFLVFSSIYFP